jgi:hypothetical protein
MSVIRSCEYALAASGVFAALQVLNASTPYRFTGIYRFDGGWVKSIWLYDRLTPTLKFGSDVRWDDSYCRITATDGDMCEITNSRQDPRLTMHAARERVQSYVAVLLNYPDGSAFGTLCHYDVEPRRTPAGTLDTLRAVKPLVEQGIQSELASAS